MRAKKTNKEQLKRELSAYMAELIEYVDNAMDAETRSVSIPVDEAVELEIVLGKAIQAL